MFDDEKEQENLFDLNISQNSNINMNMGTPPSKAQNPIPWWTPSTSFRASRVEIPKQVSHFGENWSTKRWKELKLTDGPLDPNKYADSPLTFVPDNLWNQFCEWSMKPV